ncbi:MAG: hypothetical protein JNJ54_04150 [Myxococcaceae bacterium]|nr:hypothetical protein [Myxococcaceae bacterium]
MKRPLMVVVVMACACGSPSTSDGGVGGGSAAGGTAAGGSTAGGSAGGGSAGGGSAAGGSAAGGSAAGGSAAGGSAAGGSAAGGSAGGSPIGTCPTVTTAGIAPMRLECPPSLPMNVGGTIVPGTYRSTSVVLGQAYQVDAGTGLCAAPTMILETIRLRLAATMNQRVLDYEFARTFVLPDGGAVPGIGAGRGLATISPDGQMISFGTPSCSLTDAGIYDLSDAPRVFVATPTTFAFDCCRATTPDAGGSPLADTAAYMVFLTRE